MKIRLILISMLLVTSCATNSDIKDNTSNRPIETNSSNSTKQPIETEKTQAVLDNLPMLPPAEGMRRIYFIRSEATIKDIEKGWSKLAKFGMGALAVAAAIAVGSKGSSSSGAGVYYQPFYSSRSPNAKFMYDTFRVIDGSDEIELFQTFAMNDQPLFIDVAENETSNFALAVYQSGLFHNKYVKELSQVTVDKPEQGWLTVVVLGPQNSNTSYGLRLLKLASDDADFCSGLNELARKSIEETNVKKLEKAINKKQVELMSNYSAKFVGPESNLESSQNFIAACNAVRLATKAAPHPSSEFVTRYEEQKEKKSDVLTNLLNPNKAIKYQTISLTPLQ